MAKSIERDIFKRSLSSAMGYPDPWAPEYDDPYCVSDILVDSSPRLPAELSSCIVDREALAVVFGSYDGFGLTADYGDKMNDLIHSQEQAKRLLAEKGGDPDHHASRHAKRRQAMGKDPAPPPTNDQLLPVSILESKFI
jgi:hypothetical protein